MTVRDAFRTQSRACAKLDSPFMGRLMQLFADRLRSGTKVADHILNWPGDPIPSADSVPLRLAGALHALRLEGVALNDAYPPNDITDDVLWSAVETAMDAHATRLLAWMESAPQTNEVRRAAVLAPALAAVAAAFRKPLALIELGASGGLNLRADLFRVDAGGARFGPGGDSAVTLLPEWSGPAPQPAQISVPSRTGIDLAPIDPTTPDGRLRLLAYLWPDQPERLARTDAAIGIARKAPASLIRADAAEGLSSALAVVPAGALPVVFHTVAWQYFPPATSDRAKAILADCVDPVVRIGMEADGVDRGAGLTLTVYPEGRTHDLGRADFHGRWIDWRGLPDRL